MDCTEYSFDHYRVNIRNLQCNSLANFKPKRNTLICDRNEVIHCATLIRFFLLQMISLKLLIKLIRLK